MEWNINHLNEHPVMILESEALAKWCNGDPNGFIDISSNDVVYFDPFLNERLIGIDSLKKHYDKLRGKTFAKSYCMNEPIFNVMNSVAILSYNFKSITKDNIELSWICTEVYQKNLSEVWKITLTHWSLLSKK